MGKFAPVYLTAVLEYLTAEVLEQAGIISKMLQYDRVTPQHIRLAIREDEGSICNDGMSSNQSMSLQS